MAEAAPVPPVPVPIPAVAVVDVDGELNQQQQDAFNHVLNMFPRLEQPWLRLRLLSGISTEMIIEQVLNPQRFNVPFVKQLRRRLSSVQSPVPRKMSRRSSYISDHRDTQIHANLTDEEKASLLESVKVVDQQAALSMLANKYRKLHCNSLQAVLVSFDHNFYEASRALAEFFGEEGDKNLKAGQEVVFTFPQEGVNRSLRLRVNKVIRPLRRLPATLPEYLQVQERVLNTKPSTSPVPPPSRAVSAVFECVICMSEHPLTVACFCTNGHMFCGECVAGYVKESVYGQAKATLKCMENKCDGSFEIKHVRKFVDAALAKKLEECATEEAIMVLGPEAVTRCKYCGYGAILEAPADVDKVFECAKCNAQICRLCERDWDDEHMGRKCEELDKDNIETKRRKYEEEMTQAVIRPCHKCKVPLQKSDGCNRLTCKCKATMCYICRTPNITYQHFCNHPREPGQKCTVCSRCFLWEDADKSDRNKLREMQAQANDELPGPSKINVISNKSPVKPQSVPKVPGQRVVVQNGEVIFIQPINQPHGQH